MTRVKRSTICGIRLAAAVLAVAAAATPLTSQTTPAGFTLTDVARDAGVTAVTVFGGQRSNRYLLETTGCGVALFDYDNDGLLDIFLVNGTTLEGFPKGAEPTSHLYRNKGDGTFEDVTAKAGVRRDRLGTRCHRRRLRQRRRRGSVRHLLRAESPVSQQRRRQLHRGHRRRRSEERARALGHGRRLHRLRSRRPSRPFRRQLHRSRSRHGADARLRAVPLQRRPGRLRTTGSARREERALSQQGRRHLRRRVRTHGHPQGQRAPTASASAPSTSTTTAGRISTWRTTRIQARSIGTTAMVPSPTLACGRAAHTARTANRRLAWASGSATTIAMARSTW